MDKFFAIVIVVLMIMTVISLIRGIMAFAKSTKVDLQHGTGGPATEMQLKQNRMMWARIKWQAAAVLVVALLMAISR